MQNIARANSVSKFSVPELSNEEARRSIPGYPQEFDLEKTPEMTLSELANLQYSPTPDVRSAYMKIYSNSCKDSNTSVVTEMLNLRQSLTPKGLSFFNM
jgi:hypothetical protein